MAIPCTVYIDESGDLGIERGKRWFVLTAVIANCEDENDIRKRIQNVRTRLNVRVLHFRKLSDFDRKVYAVGELDKERYELINIVIDTSKLTLRQTRDGDKPSFVTYNFATRLLLERVSWLLRDTDRVGSIMLSARGTKRDEDLKEYIENKLLPYSENKIENVFTTVSYKQAAIWDLLQLADTCATSLFYAYEENPFGYVTPYFSRCLSKHYYRYNGKVMNYGLKYYATDMDPGDEYFKERTL